MPGPGKTALAEALSSELGSALLAKDEIKERLFDTLGTGDVEWSRQVGTATYVLLFAIAQRLLLARQHAILEASFFRGLGARVRGSGTASHAADRLLGVS
jgi:predicted kinase